MCGARHKKVTAGWTLIEALVAVAILAVLVGLLYVVSRSAIKGAQVTACINQLAQIGKALELYTGANDGFYPSQSWFGVHGKPPNIAGFQESLVAHGLPRRMWLSPADPYAGQDVDSENVNHRVSSYAMTKKLFFAGRVTDSGAFILDPSRVEQPSAVPAFYFDTFLKKDENAPKGLVRWSAMGPRVTVLYVDGRAAAVPFDQP
ncbi:MAG: type II secretion system protein [Fimbriimonadaceae bacterium]|nr:type II secretion system protein [Fimbriimonadaceae bacterium]QYK58170.1 MAG: type II secretion system protein [Fimbriimonadaceae bacterium]